MIDIFFYHLDCVIVITLSLLIAVNIIFFYNDIKETCERGLNDGEQQTDNRK